MWFRDWMWTVGSFGMRIVDWILVGVWCWFLLTVVFVSEASNPIDKMMAFLTLCIGTAIISDQIWVDWYGEYTD